MVILHLITEKPRHGYQIIKDTGRRAGGVCSPSPGVIDPILTLLEELGQVTVSASGNSRKLHAITDQGHAFLEATAPRWMPCWSGWQRLAAPVTRTRRHRSCAPWRT